MPGMLRFLMLEAKTLLSFCTLKPNSQVTFLVENLKISIDKGVVLMKLFGGRGGHEEGKGHIYRMNEKLVSIGDDYWIEDETGERAFRVDGKALRIRNTLIFKDLQGNDLYKITEKLLRIRDTMDIKRADDSLAATVKKDLINILRDKWRVEIPDGHDIEIRGNILDHEYEIESEGKKIAEVSKKWFRLRDTYGIEIEPGQDNALILAIAVALDQMAHD